MKRVKRVLGEMEVLEGKRIKRGLEEMEMLEVRRVLRVWAVSA